MHLISCVFLFSWSNAEIHTQVWCRWWHEHFSYQQSCYSQWTWTLFPWWHDLQLSLPLSLSFWWKPNNESHLKRDISLSKIHGVLIQNWKTALDVIAAGSSDIHKCHHIVISKCWCLKNNMTSGIKKKEPTLKAKQGKAHTYTEDTRVKVVSHQWFATFFLGYIDVWFR